GALLATYQQLRSDHAAGNDAAVRQDLATLETQRQAVLSDRRAVEQELSQSHAALHADVQSIRQDRATIHRDMERLRRDEENGDHRAVRRDRENIISAHQALQAAEADMRQDIAAIHDARNDPGLGDRQRFRSLNPNFDPEGEGEGLTLQEHQA